MGGLPLDRGAKCINYVRDQNISVFLKGTSRLSRVAKVKHASIPFLFARLRSRKFFVMSLGCNIAIFSEINLRFHPIVGAINTPAGVGGSKSAQLACYSHWLAST